MSPEFIRKHFPNASRAFYEANCRIPLGLESPERKPDPVQALVPGKKVQRGGKGSVVVCVEIIALKHRCSDSDNIVAGAKALRDCIARSLGVDDADKRIRWSYGTCQTSGREQTIVRISVK